MKQRLNYIVNIAYLFILNNLFSIIIFKNISGISILYSLITSIFVISIIKLVTDIIAKEKIRKIVNILVVGFITILYIAQMVHYYFYECFFSFYSLTKGGQVLGFYKFIIKVICNHILQIGIIVIALIIYIILIKKITNPKSKTNTIIEVISLFVMPLIFVMTVFIDSNGIYSSKDLLTNSNSNTLNFKKFGLIPGEIIDIYRYFNPLETEIITDEISNENYSEAEYNITKTDLQKETDDPTIKNLNKYFLHEKPTNKNEYTGTLKGKNLIFITGESFDFNIIDKDITPNLYKLKEEGLYFTNHYTPIYYASTSDGEYTNLTGNLPHEGIWSYLKSYDKDLPYSYGNVLKTQGYKTYSYHNGEYDFYDRYKLASSFGFDNFKACGDKLNINCKLWPQSDEEMFEKTVDDYINDEKFVSYYMTISGHLMHDFKTNDIAKKWEANTQNLSYSKPVKAYISASIDLDKGLGYLMDKLEEKNKLDDTVIVLVPDHFPYGLMKKELKEIQTLDNSYDLHKTGLIIYNSKLNSKKIDNLSSNIDILPTLLNMYGISYDSRLIIGKDIMSDSEKIVIFNDHSFLVNEGYYDAKKDKFHGKIKKDKLDKLKKEANNKFNASNIMIDKDYYRYLLQ